jgi:serine/threonine protein kinase
MAKCTGCNTELPDDAVFCPRCATRVGAQSVAPATAAGVATISGLDTISGTKTITGTGSQKAAAVLAEGAVFHGRYVIERPLGAGAMGVVYAAKDQVTDRPVALKLITPALADRPTARERFLREGLMARDVRHANVVAMYDVGEADGQVYLVMEYLSGETLRKWLHRTLKEDRDIPFDTARGIIRSVLEGLAAAHATGVVHRDLKPENVMLMGDPHKGDYSLKILDFGIARAVGAASHLTTTSSSTGTPLYMAPEQKTAADTVGPAADLYAVTAMLYELLLGVAPEGRLGAPSRERPDLPPGIDAVIETGLANRPRSRYQSAQEYIRALDSVGAAVGREPPKRPDITAGTLAPPPEPPPPSPPRSEAESWPKWLRTHSPGWVLWDRLSKRQRYVVGAIGLLAVLLWIGYSLAPPEPSPMNIAGRWADEVAGTGVVAAYVDVGQQGTSVSGVIYDSYGNRAGTFTGQVQGTNLEYGYVANNGMTGTGRGRLRDDGNHLDVEVRDNATGMTERHTLHRNHVPPQ